MKIDGRKRVALSVVNTVIRDLFKRWFSTRDDTFYRLYDVWVSYLARIDEFPYVRNGDRVYVSTYGIGDFKIERTSLSGMPETLISFKELYAYTNRYLARP